ncbi:unnamed protein product, partial [Iphiclides podalirius]
MQVTQADSSKCKRAGVEDFTNKPTFNSNKMKKFIISKIEHNETTNRATPTATTPTATTPEPPSTPNSSKQDALKPEVQPPLPLDPPPPDKPPNMSLTLKEEVEDIEYNSPGEEPSSDTMNHSESTIDRSKTNGVDEAEKSRPMCRDFIRGKCIRPGTCKFRHQCDVSQLVGIYTFCRNFQNSVCTLPNCKYVHATVFEEQRFYRTGELPPHALAHHKKVNILPPPPPPPEEAPSDIQTMFNNPPPPLPVSIEKQTPVISCIAASKMDTRTFPDDLRAALSTAGTNTSPLKREWANIENSVCSSPGGHDFDPDRLPKRCRNCECVKFREKIIKDKYEKEKKAKMEVRQNMEILANKRDRLSTTLRTLIRPTYQAKMAGSGLNTTPNVNAERQKWLLDQLSPTINSSLMTGIQDDINRNNLNGNLSNLVAKLLNVYRQNILTSDTSQIS